MEKIKFLLSDDNFDKELKNKVLPYINRRRKDLLVSGHDGAYLRAYVYESLFSNKVVCISHGFCEFIEKYSETIYNFLKAGYSVAILDHRGHGYSYRKVDNKSKVHIDSYNTYVKDFHCFMNAVKGYFGKKHYFLFGHSMGGCIATLYMEKYPEMFEAAVLSSPMLDINVNGMPKEVLIAYGKLATDLAKNGEEYLGDKNQDFDGTASFEESSALNYQRWKAWFDMRLQNVHFQTHAGTIEWATASLAALKSVFKNIDKIQTPILLCQAGNDHLVPPEGQDLFVEQSMTAVDIYFADSKHEIMNTNYETRNKYWYSILYFLDSFAKQSKA